MVRAKKLPQTGALAATLLSLISGCSGTMDDNVAVFHHCAASDDVDSMERLLRRFPRPLRREGCVPQPSWWSMARIFTSETHAVAPLYISRAAPAISILLSFVSKRALRSPPKATVANRHSKRPVSGDTAKLSSCCSIRVLMLTGPRFLVQGL